MQSSSVTADSAGAGAQSIGRPARTTADGGRIEGIDFLRGIAALGVAVFHLYGMALTPEARLGLPHIVHLVSIWGRYGVQLFFVISGFVIAHTLHGRKDFDRPVDLPLYFARRMIRLDILYYAVLAMHVAATLASPATLVRDVGVTPVSFEPIAVLKNLFYFLPLQTPLFMLVAWTLAIEVQFYLFMAAVFITLNRFRVAAHTIPVFMVLTLLSLLWPLGVIRQDIGFWLTPSLYNLLGGALAYFTIRHPSRPLLAFNVLYVFAVLAGYWIVRDSHIVAALVSYFAVIATVTLAPRAFVASRIPQALGRWSYGIYLTHQWIGLVVVAPLSRAGLGLLSYRLVPVAVGLACTVAVAAVLYKLVEEPSIRLSKRIARRN